MAPLGSTLRYAFRTLRRSPGYAFVAILTLGLGIGANTAIFSVINAVVLRPLPYAQPDRLVVVNHDYPSLKLKASVSVPGFLEYEKQDQVFSAATAFTGWGPTLTGHGDASRLVGQRVAGAYFATYGVQPALGRALRPDESTAGNEHVVVLSDAFWRNSYGADPGIIGQRMLLNGESYEIVGVMPPSFTSMLNRTVDLWTPMVFTPQQRASSWGNEFLAFTARLKDGVSFETAQAEMHALAARIRTDRPDQVSDDWDLKLSPLSDQVTSAGMRRAMYVLLGAVVLVLLIACANVANLQLARAASRSREIAVRVALGASPKDLLRQLLAESMVLALAGGVLGILLALWGVPALMSLNESNLPPASAIGIDGTVLAFTLLLSLATGLVFGLAPALRVSRTSLQESLKEGGRGAAGDRGGLTLRRGLVVATVALALTLLVGAGLLTRSFSKLLQVDPGFRPDHLLTFNLALPNAKYPNDTARVAFFDRATEAIAAQPGVISAGATSVLPFTNNWSTSSFNVEGYVVPPKGNMPWGDIRIVTPDYLRTIGAPLLKGRFFTAQDVEGAPNVAIVDEELVKTYWPDADPIGKRITFNEFTDSTITWITVVGVVGHTMHEGLDAEKRIQYYLPLAQAGNNFMAYAVRTTAPPLQAVASVREALKSVDPDVALANIDAMDALVSTSTGPRRFSMVLLTVFSLLAAALAAIGLYGVMAYTVAQRTQELGVRLALGATPGSVQRMVMGQGMRLALVGVGFGLVAAVALTNLLKALDSQAAVGATDRLLFNVSAQDPFTFVAIPLLLLGVTLLASWVPARRATALDPVEALRGE
ncbi:MAG TPA: ABC transporter permease [Gemmatimonadales bacterium]|nr:ABC transporter permease [Gemmatimonadales bacterium]